VELWLTLGRTGYEVHAVSFYNSDDATVVFERWWRDKHREAVKDAEQPKRRKRP
jgi:predicted ATP-grasp superfamily ATP-dependent carboligase